MPRRTGEESGRFHTTVDGHSFCGRLGWQLQRLLRQVVADIVSRSPKLTPPYAQLIFLRVSLWPKMGLGPMWSAIANYQQQSCGKYWFSHLFYINNLCPDVLGDEVSVMADRLRFHPVLSTSTDFYGFIHFVERISLLFKHLVLN